MPEIAKDWGAGLGAWGQAEPIQHLYPLLAQELVDDPDPYGKARDAGLPIPPQRQYDTVADFFERGEEGVAELSAAGVEKFFISLRPVVADDPLFKKRRALGIPRDKIMARLATGLQTPTYCGESNMRGAIQYSFDNPRLIAALSRALRCIPSIRGSRRELDPCYAEFSLINRRGVLAPVFFDYKTSRAMTSIDSPTEPWRALEERRTTSGK